MNDKELISLVQNYSFLYDKTTVLFKDKEAKESAWQAISAEMRTPVDICIRWWTSLRERFSREVRHYKSSGTTTWHLYSAMSFLEPCIKPRYRTKFSSSVLATDSSKVDTAGLYVLDKSEMFVSTSPAPSYPDLYNPRAGMHFTSPEGAGEECEPGTSSDKTKWKESEVCQNQPQTKNIAVESFGRMITDIVHEMSAAKQSKAMLALTALVMAIKEEEPDSEGVKIAWSGSEPIPLNQSATMAKLDPLHWNPVTLDQDDNDHNTLSDIQIRIPKSDKTPEPTTNTINIPMKRKAMETLSMPNESAADVDEAFCDALKSFKKLCHTREERKGNEALHGFGQMIISTIAGMSTPKQAKAMMRVTEVVMQIKLEPEEPSPR